MMNYGELDARPNVVLTKDLIKKSLPKYRRHDDLIIINENAWEDFKKSLPIVVVKSENSPFSIDEDELASLVCQAIQKPTCKRVAIERGVKNDGYRTPNISLILGENGLVNHKDNHILYQFDVTKCMFSFGNVREKMRMAELRCSNEIVVDLFAGIGYFSLPLLMHAKAKHLYACEWNPDAIGALKKNLTLNKIDSDRYTVIEGDNRLNRPLNVAQRIILGILPSCMDWMKTALECVDKKTGAILHCHDLVEARPTTATTMTTQTKMTNQCSNDQQNVADCSGVSTAADKQRSSSENQSLLNQSLSSNSTSSHSIIEKLSAPSEDSRLLQSSESDKDTSSPVLLEKPSSSLNANFSYNSSTFDATATTNSTSIDQMSLTSSHHEDSILEPPLLAENDINLYESRGFALVACIKEELDANNLIARLLHIQPVKSYAPRVNHVVFDIRVEPRQLSSLGGSTTSNNLNTNKN